MIDYVYDCLGCNALLCKSEQFWPESDTETCNTVVTGGKEIDIYNCRVKFSEEKNDQASICESFKNDVVTIIPLNCKVLEKFLTKGQCRKS